MDLYGQKSKSIPQKIVIHLLELLLLGIAYWILFGAGGNILEDKTGLRNAAPGSIRRIIIFTFSVIVFFRLALMMTVLLKRSIPWQESISVPFAFALYYVGFAVLVLPTAKPTDLVDLAGIVLFLTGCGLNTFSELQRHFWKQHPENKGQLYTGGLFRYSMHINYFGDLLWVSGYAVLTRNWWSIIIPAFLFCLFAFYNIPKLDQYLRAKYGRQFDEYRKRTSAFIPFIY